MRTCLICGDRTRKPVRAVLEHLALWDWKHSRGCLLGTYRTFGFVAALTLFCPLACTLIYWRHRKAKLQFEFCGDESCEVKP